MNQARVHIGVDVGKECLDICYPDGSKEHIGNTKRSRAKPIRKARDKVGREDERPRRAI